jgi:hypothetical protein
MKIYKGDVLEQTNHLESHSVDLVVTSPPYENEFGKLVVLKPKRVPEGKRFDPESGWIAEMKVFVPKPRPVLNSVKRQITLQIRQGRTDVTVGKFDGIVGNPPYLGQQQVHQKFFNKSFKILKNEGSLVFIQPATPYLNKKSPDKRKHEKKMQSIVTTHETNVKILGPEVFEGAAIAGDLAITAIQKKPANAINVVQYKDGSTFKNVSLQDINMTSTEPTLYASITDKYNKIVQEHGSLHDVTYFRDKKPVANILRLQKIRGHMGQDDFYTFISRNQKQLTSSCKQTSDFGIRVTSDTQLDNVHA